MDQPDQAASAPPTPASFLGLPLELRWHIYSFCLPRDDFSKESGYLYPSYTAFDFNYPAYLAERLDNLLLVCRQINDEVETMLYAKNTFKVHVHETGEEDLKILASKRNRDGKLRKMVWFLRSCGASYHPDFRLDTGFWDGLLGNLSTFGLVVELPRHSLYETWKDWEDRCEEWKAWVTPLLQYLGRAILKTVLVVVDASQQKKMIKIVETVMPGRCRFQDLLSGDPVFEE